MGNAGSHFTYGRQTLSLDEPVLGLRQIAIGIFDPIIEDGILDGHAGLIGEEL